MLKKLVLISLIGFLAYILSILWRVSVAEAKYFGRSDLIHLSLNPPKYRKKGMPKVPEAYGSGVFIFNRQGKPMMIWRQKVNGFQHIYGSALAAYELGDKPSDLLFCGNEYMEAVADLIFDKNGIEISDLRDRRKDLYHNALGRQFGIEAKKKGLRGKKADRYIQNRILELVDNGKVYIPHYNDTKVSQLKSERKMGCPGLPPAISLYIPSSWH